MLYDKNDKQEPCLNLSILLRYMPFGTPLYSTILGDVKLHHVSKDYIDCPIVVFKVMDKVEHQYTFTANGAYSDFKYTSECTLFPSKENRDWLKFYADNVDKFKFNPKELKVFDKVLVNVDNYWMPAVFTYLDYSLKYPRMMCYDKVCRVVIPFNDETKHLVGKFVNSTLNSEYTPHKYKYWE